MTSMGLVQIMPNRSYIHVKWEDDTRLKISDSKGSITVDKEALENLLRVISTYGEDEC